MSIRKYLRTDDYHKMAGLFKNLCIDLVAFNTQDLKDKVVKLDNEDYPGISTVNGDDDYEGERVIFQDKVIFPIEIVEDGYMSMDEEERLSPVFVDKVLSKQSVIPVLVLELMSKTTGLHTPHTVICPKCQEENPVYSVDHTGLLNPLLSLN